MQMGKEKTVLECQKLQSKFALLPAKNEIITIEHVQALIDSEAEELVKLKYEDVKK